MTRIIAKFTGSARLPYYNVLELGEDGFYTLVGGSADLSIAKRIATPEHPANQSTGTAPEPTKRRPGRPKKATA